MQLAVDRALHSSLRLAASHAAPELRWYRYARILCAALERVARGEVKRLMVVAPPQVGKSTMAARLMAAWYLLRNPSHPVILASYAAQLATDLSRDARRYFLNMGGELDASTTAANRWKTTEGGGLFAAGVGGALTGISARLMILDDLIRGRQDADSERVRETTIHWLREVAWSRIMANPDAAVIVIGTRWHENDPMGWLLDRERGAEHPEGWHIVWLDMEHDPEGREVPDTCTVEPDWREPGDLLCPIRWDAEWVATARETLGVRGYDSLCQGRPRPREGLMFKSKWWRYLPEVPSSVTARVRAWDLAGSDSGQADQTAGVRMARFTTPEGGQAWIVEDVVAERWTLAERLEGIGGTARADGYGVSTVIEQDSGVGGMARTQQLIAACAPAVATTVTPSGSKVFRAEPLAAQCEAGNVYLLRGEWNRKFVDELSRFPVGKHDDQTDAAAHAFNQLAAAPTVEIGESPFAGIW